MGSIAQTKLNCAAHNERHRRATGLGTTIKYLRAGSRRNFSKFFAKYSLILSTAKCAKYGLFSEEYHTILRRWRCFGEIMRAKSSFTESVVVIIVETFERSQRQAWGGRVKKISIRNPPLFIKHVFVVNFVLNMAKYGLFFAK
jgi:hypothetical protein